MKYDKALLDDFTDFLLKIKKDRPELEYSDIDFHRLMALCIPKVRMKEGLDALVKESQEMGVYGNG